MQPSKRITCPTCGEKNWPGEIYCGKCSENLSLRKQHQEKYQDYLISL